jgi:hypothetical protein
VSKTVAHGAVTSAYAIIALTGRKSIASLSALLVNRPDIRSRVRFLFLCDEDPPPGAMEIPIGTSILQLLTHVSSTLEALALVPLHDKEWGVGAISILNAVPMPVLRFLTLRTMYIGVEPLQSMPALTRLHISADQTYYLGYWEFLANSSNRMPCLSSLTLSGLRQTFRTRGALEHFLISRPQWQVQHEQEKCVDCMSRNNRQVHLAPRTSYVTLFLGSITDEPEDSGDVSEPFGRFRTKIMEQVGPDRELEFKVVPHTLKRNDTEGWRAFWLQQVLSWELDHEDYYV